MQVWNIIRSPSKPVALLIGLASVGVLGLLDYLTGYEVSMFVFYAIPIVGVAWFADKKSALLIAVISGMTWWWADQLALHPYRWGWLQAWETLVRLGFFLFAALSGAVIKAQHESTKARIRLLEHSRQLEHEIVNISEEQQRRIGRDLHDGICQHLAALGYSASSLEKDLQQAGHAGLASSAKDLSARLKDAVVQTRDLARGLVPVQAETVGLGPALEELAALSRQLLGIDCVYVGDATAPALDQSAANHLYRIAQEGINNATKHGQASRVSLNLISRESAIELRVTDNGVGFEQGTIALNGMGLNIMHYRARCLNGDLNIRSAPSAGTVLSCTVPRRVIVK